MFGFVDQRVMRMARTEGALMLEDRGAEAKCDGYEWQRQDKDLIDDLS